MRKFELSFSNERTDDYPIFFGSECLEEALKDLALERYSKIALVADKKVYQSWQKRLNNIKVDALVLVEAREEQKSLDTVRDVCQKFYEAKLDRHSLVINIGGGLTTDLGGFAASIYMRGIDFIHVPTSLLAQVDAGVGGKVGVNFAETKNLLGAFKQPRAVVMDSSFLKTLSKREYHSGFGELIKHAFIKDEELFKRLQEKKDIDELVEHSCKIKAEVVSADEKEGGLRKILNFGHTFGHAAEILSEGVLLHGEAVSIGMVVAARLSVMKGYLTEADFTSIKELLVAYELPTRLPFKVEFEALYQKMLGDKKNNAGVIKWVLLKRIGEAIYDQEVSAEELKAASQEVLE